MPRLPSGLILVFLLTGALLPPAISALAQDKLTIPADTAQAKALGLIKEVYGQEWEAAKTSAQKQALATKLLQKATETTDATDHYVLLHVAQNLAADAGDAELAFKAIEGMAARYEVDAYKLNGAALAQAAKEASSAQSVAVAKLSLSLIDEAVGRDDFGAAKFLGGLAGDAARKGRDTALAKDIVARNREIEEIGQAFAEIQDAWATLKQLPVDPDANLAVGRYYCLIKGNWDRGLPMMALGSDEKLKELAVKELKGVPDAAGQVALGDGWWDLVGASEGVAQKQLQGRAAFWYRKALPGLTGLVKDKVERRLPEVQQADADHVQTTPTSTYLSDLEPVGVKTRYDNLRSTFQISGRTSMKGFRAHPFTNSPSIITFHLPKGYRRLSGAAGIGDPLTAADKRIKQASTALIFEIRGDRRSLWRSQPLRTFGTLQEFSVNISGVSILELYVHCPGDWSYAWARWVDPVLNR